MNNALRLPLSLILPTLITLFLRILDQNIPASSYSIIFLMGVLITATYGGVAPAILCALSSFLFYNFFLTDPRFTFLMTNREDVITGIIFVLVAMITGQQAAKVKEKVAKLDSTNKFLVSQIQLSESLAQCFSHDQVKKSVIENLRTILPIKSIHIEKSGEGDQSFALNSGNQITVKHNDDQIVIFMPDGKNLETLHISLLKKLQKCRKHISMCS